VLMMTVRSLSVSPSSYRTSGLFLSFFFLLWGCSADLPSSSDIQPRPDIQEDLITTVTRGTVTEVLTAGEYTVACMSSGKLSYWLATERTNLGIGDEVVFNEAQVMRDFYSPALNRQFPVILFVNKVTVARSSSSQEARPRSLPSGHPMVDEKQKQGLAVEPPPAGAVPRALGGYTVAELYQKKQILAGSRVRVAGKVVKINPNIMGVNWIHLQDGTGVNGDDDLTVTCSGQPNLGTVVTAEGVLVAGKTFQKGFHIPLLIENASLTGVTVSAH